MTTETKKKLLINAIENNYWGLAWSILSSIMVHEKVKKIVRSNVYVTKKREMYEA